MLDYKQAIEIAKRLRNEHPINEVLDFGKCYAVGCNLGEMPEPGLPAYILVDKETGQAEYLTIPPIENLKRLESASVVWFSK